MKILVIGSGAREHALVWKLRQSPLAKQVLCAPGNAGIAKDAECVDIGPSAVADLAKFATDKKIDLTVVGPELPLTLGIVDEFQKRGLAIFGATQAAAAIESSKVFAKEFMTRHRIPTAAFETATTADAGRAILKRRTAGYPVVLKADGLAAGKGVIVARDAREADKALDLLLVEKRFGAACDRVIIEDCLEGPEASFFVLTDGKRAVPLATCQDYKRLEDGDAGPNTGGMGGYSPSVHVDAKVFQTVMESIITPTIRGLNEEDRPYKGILYAGLMLTRSGPQVLEFNARFGDPEAQLILARMRSDLLPLLQATLSGRLQETPVEWKDPAAVCVVLAAPGYPEKPETGGTISGTEKAAAMPGIALFHAGTRAKNGTLTTSGGRVLTVTATGATFKEAATRCYAAVDPIRFPGRHYRNDIAAEAQRAERV